jgi:YidC/Oxa1 family membrane protein insertase
MSTEKRLVAFVILSVTLMFGMNFVLDRLGMLPKPKPQVAQQKETIKPADEPVAQKDEKPGAEAEQAPADKPADVAAKDAPEIKPVTPPTVLVDPRMLVLGSEKDNTPGGYRLQVQLSQRGAGVAKLTSSRIDAEFEEGKPRHRPLTFIASDPKSVPSFSLNQVSVNVPNPGDEDLDKAQVVPLKNVLWDVVLGKDGKAVHPIVSKTGKEGQEIQFRAVAGTPEVQITKTYRLFKDQDGFEMDLTFASPDAERSVVYQLLGPHGIPIEGEWYTSTFRDAYFGRIDEGAIDVATVPVNTIVKYKDDPERYGTLPLKYAGIENQYFAIFVEPLPTPKVMADSTIEEAKGILINENKAEAQRSDISVELLSKSFVVGPNVPSTQSFRVFAGPKTVEALAAYNAEDLAKYRKGWSLPIIGDLGASFVSKRLISPSLTYIYNLTEQVAKFFGGTKGNYGIAIILLTIVVRLCLFPLSRKQAKAAKKMQDLQPHMIELKAKYKDEKEQLTKETFALYKRHGVNPMGGCLPALIQLPILIGLWQALNSSVALRQSSFLWIDNLAAPDMLFKFPFDMSGVPLVGHWIGPYFNLLPILVVALMQIQTKLFSPPPTTPEAETQQKMMKYMMVFMMFMFYKVPSGLGLYFITSSLWQISERLLLPKVTKTAPPQPAEADSDGRGSGGSRGSSSDGGIAPKSGWLDNAKDRARKKLEQLMDEASKNSTVRNKADDPRPRDRDKPRPKPDRRR